MSETVQQTVLLISPLSSASPCAAALEQSLGLRVEAAASLRSALTALRRRGYAAVIVDEGFAEGNPAAAELLAKGSGLAPLVYLNFAISGSARAVREVRAALDRRRQEQTLALRTAATMLEGELRSALTGLLLHSELALAEPGLTPRLRGRLNTVSQLAGSLRSALQHAAAAG